MTQQTIPVAAPQPIVLIFGIVTGRLRPQAARFRADEIELARYMAAKLNLAMLTIDVPLLEEIGLVIPEWQLRPDDQVVILSVRGEIFEQLRQLVRPVTSGDTAANAGTDGGGPVIQVNALGTPLVPKPALDAKQATRLTRPLLLVHGEDDTNVPFKQFKLMRDAAAKAGKPVELLTFADEGHGFSKEEDATKWLDTLGAFLTKNNPAD